MFTPTLQDKLELKRLGWKVDIIDNQMRIALHKLGFVPTEAFPDNPDIIRLSPKLEERYYKHYSGFKIRLRPWVGKANNSHDYAIDCWKPDGKGDWDYLHPWNLLSTPEELNPYLAKMMSA